MADSVARQKDQFHGTDSPPNKFVGRLAEGRLDRDSPHGFESRHLIQSAAADDTDHAPIHDDLTSPDLCR